jgi:hypothetical protein
MPSPPPATPPPPPVVAVAARSRDARIVVRPMPKVVFFYMTWVASLVCGILVASLTPPPEHVGTIWLAIFTLNLLVISFDFTELVSLTVGALLVAFLFAGLYFGWLTVVGRFLTDLSLVMNAAFYYAVFGVFTTIYALVWLRSRFEYWEFRHNEVLHRSGVFGEIKRYSTEDLKWFKEIPDVLERILLGSGRMVLTTPREPHPIVIEHVIGIERKDERIAALMGTKQVTIR